MKLKKTVQRVRRGISEKPVEALLISFLLCAAAIPIVTMAFLLVRYSVNAPFYDQWEYVFLLHKQHLGTLNFYDLWVQHNEHRILVPRLVTLGLAPLTDYNVRYYIMLNFVTATATFSFLMLLLRRTFGKLNMGTAALTVLIAWLLYSPIQWINWIWGFQMAFFMCVFFSILTIWLVTKTESKSYPRFFYVALATGAIATYCVGNGIVIWAVGLILLLQRTELKKIMIWLAAASAVTLSYIYKFHRAPGSLSLMQIAREPIGFAKYCLGYLGRNLAWTPTGARYTGAVLLILLAASLIAIYKKGRLDKILAWLGVALYVLMTMLLAASSRLNLGIDQGLVDSYTTMSVLFVISTVVIVGYAAQLLLKNTVKTRYHAALAAVFIAGVFIGPMFTAFVHNYSAGLTKMQEQSRHLSKVQRCIYSARSENDDCLLFAYPNKKIAWQGIQILKQQGWGNFGNSK